MPRYLRDLKPFLFQPEPVKENKNIKDIRPKSTLTMIMMMTLNKRIKSPIWTRRRLMKQEELVMLLVAITLNMKVIEIKTKRYKLKNILIGLDHTWVTL